MEYFSLLPCGSLKINCLGWNPPNWRVNISANEPDLAIVKRHVCITFEGNCGDVIIIAYTIWSETSEKHVLETRIGFQDYDKPTGSWTYLIISWISRLNNENSLMIILNYNNASTTCSHCGNCFHFMGACKKNTQCLNINVCCIVWGCPWQAF